MLCLMPYSQGYPDQTRDGAWTYISDATGPRDGKLRKAILGYVDDDGGWRFVSQDCCGEGTEQYDPSNSCAMRLLSIVNPVDGSLGQIAELPDCQQSHGSLYGGSGSGGEESSSWGDGDDVFVPPPGSTKVECDFIRNCVALGYDRSDVEVMYFRVQMDGFVGYFDPPTGCQPPHYQSMGINGEFILTSGGLTGWNPPEPQEPPDHRWVVTPCLWWATHGGHQRLSGRFATEVFPSTKVGGGCGCNDPTAIYGHHMWNMRDVQIRRSPMCGPSVPMIKMDLAEFSNGIRNIDGMFHTADNTVPAGDLLVPGSDSWTYALALAIYLPYNTPRCACATIEPWPNQYPGSPDCELDDEHLMWYYCNAASIAGSGINHAQVVGYAPIGSLCDLSTQEMYIEDIAWFIINIGGQAWQLKSKNGELYFSGFNGSQRMVPGNTWITPATQVE